MTTEIKNTILIVDDEPDIVNLTEKFLKLGDFDTITCNSVKMAIKILKESYDKIDLILLNIMMPGRGGYSILEEVNNNEMYNHIHVILNSTRDFYLLYGNQYLRLPFSGKELLQAVRDILSGEEVE